MANLSVNELVEAFGKTISERGKVISEQEKIISQHEKTISERDRVISNLRTCNQNQMQDLENKNKEIEKCKIDANVHFNNNAWKDKKIEQLENELRDLKAAHEKEKQQISPLSNIHTSVIHARVGDIAKLTSANKPTPTYDYYGYNNNNNKNPTSWTTINNKKWGVLLEKSDDLMIAWVVLDSPYSEIFLASFKIHLISHNSEKIIHTVFVDTFYRFDKTNPKRGYKFISISDLLDEKKGFVKDDAVLIAVEIKMFPSA